MPESLTSETALKLDDASRSLARKHRLDESARAELRARMESKLLAYLSSAEKLTENDAFVLVREHFGDPEVIGGMLMKVHRTEAMASLVRKIAAVLVLTLAAGLAGYCLELIFRIGCLAAFGSAGMFIPWKENAGLYCGAALFAVVLVYWRKRMNNGDKLWFQTAGPLAVVLIIAAFLCLDTLIPFLVCLDPTHLLNIPPSMLPDLPHGRAISEGHHQNPYWVVQYIFKPAHSTTLGSKFSSFLVLAYIVFQCALWLWWCDTPPRNSHVLFITAGAWALYSFIITSFQPKPIFHWDHTGKVFFRTNWYQTVGYVPGWLFAYLLIIVLASVIYVTTAFAFSRRLTSGMDDTMDHMSQA